MLQFDVYASGRQSNGLSTVWVGDVDVLEREFLRARHGLQVDLMTGLTWLSMVLGVLALCAGLVLRQQPVFMWFGLTSLVNGLANMGNLTTHVVVGVEGFSWFVFASRLISVALGMIMFAAFFGKLRPGLRNAVLL